MILDMLWAHFHSCFKPWGYVVSYQFYVNYHPCFLSSSYRSSPLTFYADKRHRHVLVANVTWCIFAFKVQQETRHLVIPKKKENWLVFRGDAPCVSFSVEECVHGRYSDTVKMTGMSFLLHTRLIKVVFKFSSPDDTEMPTAQALSRYVLWYVSLLYRLASVVQVQCSSCICHWNWRSGQCRPWSTEAWPCLNLSSNRRFRPLPLRYFAATITASIGPTSYTNSITRHSLVFLTRLVVITRFVPVQLALSAS